MESNLYTQITWKKTIFQVLLMEIGAISGALAMFINSAVASKMFVTLSPILQIMLLII